MRIRKFCSSTFFWAFSTVFVSIFGFERHLLALLVDRAEFVEDFVDAVAGEEADHVVLGGEEEAGLAGVALAAGAAAQLVVDAARLVALGAADEEPAELPHFLGLGLDLRRHLGDLLLERLLVALVARR